jgi:RES domain-containing protein
LEVLVHITNRAQMPDLVLGRAAIPDSVAVQTVETSILPMDWRRFSPYSEQTQRVGMQWLTEAETAVLRVPSAISEAEWNFLLNPAHPEFQRLKRTEPAPFLMGPRVP